MMDYVVTKEDFRPADPDKCFYCSRLPGELHKPNCVLIPRPGFLVFIRRNSDGEIRTMRYEWDWDESAEFYWAEGNAGCDCNRAIFFDRAKGIENQDRECGDSAYDVLFAQLPDGSRKAIDLTQEEADSFRLIQLAS